MHATGDLQETAPYATSRRVGWRWRSTQSLASDTLLPHDVYRRGYLHLCLDHPRFRHCLVNGAAFLSAKHVSNYLLG